MTDRVGRAGRLAVFVAVPAISAITPIVVIPSITAHLGARAWLVIAIAQSVGSGAAVLIELGWGLTGPQRVAAARPTSRSAMYGVSILTKAAALAAVSPIAIAILSASNIANLRSAVIVCVAYELSAFSPVWFFIGVGNPLAVVLIDALPRLAAAAAAAIAVSSGSSLLVFGSITLTGALVPPAVTWFLLHVSARQLLRRRFRYYVNVVGAQAVALSGRAASAAYIALPTTLVALAAPGAASTFAANERLLRLGLAVLQAVPNSMQASMGARRRGADRRDATRRAVGVNFGLGVIAMFGFISLSPQLAKFLFSGAISIPLDLTILGGLVMLITCVSRATGGLGLVAYRRLASIARSAIAGAAVGVPSMLVLSRLLGAPGGVIGELAGEVTVLAIQAGALRNAMRLSR